MNKIFTWDEFIRGHLLNHGIVNGVLLMTQHGLPVYSFGDIEHLTQPDLQQFKELFSTWTEDKDGSSYQRDFQVTLKNGKQVLYKAYQKSYSSIYATSSGNIDGLVVCNIPHGILICTYSHPVLAGEAIKRIEHFCDLIRA